MGSGLYGIGLSGLAAAHTGLVTTGHNIANADTPGFHRQATVQANANLKVIYGFRDERIMEGEQGRARRTVQAWFTNR